MSAIALGLWVLLALSGGGGATGDVEMETVSASTTGVLHVVCDTGCTASVSDYGIVTPARRERDGD